MNPDSAWFRGAVILSVVFVVEEAFLRGLRLHGVRPDMLLALAVIAGVVGGPEGGALFGFAGGMLTDLFVNTPFGLTALVASVVAFVAGSIQQTLGAPHRWTIPALTALASMSAEVGWAALGTVLGVPGLLRPHIVLVAVVVAVVNLVAALGLTPLVRFVFAGVKRVPA